MIENVIFLTLILFLTFTAKNKNIGVLVSCYYAFYISLELSYFGFVGDWYYSTFDQFAVWYLICLALTALVFIASATLFVGGNNPAGLYAFWLLVCMFFDGLSTIFQLAETNALLIVYNKIQNISVYVDLFVVFIGMDHIIKRECNAARIFIDYIDCKLEYWRVMVLLLLNTGAKCLKKS